MSKPTVEAATNDLIHALGNFLGIVRNAKRNGTPKGDIVYGQRPALGVYALDKEPELSAALDALRGALAVAKIEAEDGFRILYPPRMD
jgi:hypothetical protein